MEWYCETDYIRFKVEEKERKRDGGIGSFPNLQVELDNKRVPEDLNQVFRNYGRELSGNVLVTIKEKGKEWLVVENNRKGYEVTLSGPDSDGWRTLHVENVSVKVAEEECKSLGLPPTFDLLLEYVVARNLSRVGISLFLAVFTRYCVELCRLDDVRAALFRLLKLKLPPDIYCRISEEEIRQIMDVLVVKICAEEKQLQKVTREGEFERLAKEILEGGSVIRGLDEEMQKGEDWLIEEAQKKGVSQEEIDRKVELYRNEVQRVINRIEIDEQEKE